MRSFFSLQRPWLPTQLAIWSLLVNAVVSLALYEPLGIGGIVIGTTVSNVVLALLEGRRLRQELGGLEVTRTLRAAALMIAAAALLAAVAYGTWYGLDELLALAARAARVGRPRARARRARLRGGDAAQRAAQARQIRDLFSRRGPRSI